MARSESSEKAATVLITRFSALGDVAMSIPVVYDICRAYPEYRFVMVTKNTVAGVFVNPPPNLTVEGIDFRLYKGMWGLFRLFRFLRHTYGYTEFVDLHDVTRTKVIRILSRLTGIRVSHINKKRRERRRLIRRSQGVPLPELESSFTRYREAFNRIGLNAPVRFTTLFDDRPVNPAELTDVTGSSVRPKTEHWIAVAPFAAHNGKIYPEHLMREVISELSSRPATRLFVFGAGESEKAAIHRMTEGLSGVISMADLRIGLGRELKLLSLMDVAITMDSGNMHLAAIAGVKVVSIWGQTHPCCGFSAWRQDPSNAIGADLSCRPCSVFGNKPCAFGDYRCMSAVTPRQIINRIDQIMKLKTND